MSLQATTDCFSNIDENILISFYKIQVSSANEVKYLKTIPKLKRLVICELIQINCHGAGSICDRLLIGVPSQANATHAL